MEQPNLMGNGMAPGNMMMNSMQRPQSGNPEQQIHAKIMENLRQKQASMPQGGWQTTFDIAQRAHRILQLVSGLRMLQPDNIKSCLHVAERFEEGCFIESPNKEVYFDTMSKKMGEIHQKRQNAAQQAMQAGQMGMHMGNNNIGMPQNGMGNMNNMQNFGLGNGMNMNMNNMGMGGMNMNGMGNNGMNMGMPNQMGGNGQQNLNFPAQLQRQMQPSPLPQQNQQPQNNTLDPSALQNTQMPNQTMGQQVNQGMPQQTPRPRQPGPNMNPSQMAAGNGPVGQDLLNYVKRAYESMSEEKRIQTRAHFLSNLSEQQKAAASKDGDPLFKFLIMRAKEQFKARHNAANQQNGGNMQMNNNNNMGMNANAAQQTPSQPSFDFTSLMGQQQNAIKSQESGGEVVPASNNNNNNNNSMGIGGQMNMSQGVNPQQLLANQNNQGGNGPNQMQFLAMQQRMAQEKQRQMMQNQMNQQQGMAQQQGQNQNQLHGQRGGLNAPNALNGGQVNSPAMNMNMLNRPMAPPGQTTPSTPQPNRPQMPQTPVNNPVNQLTQHHQSMVNQNNAQMSQGGQGATPQQQVMMSNIPPAIKEKLAAMPPQQLQDVLNKARQNPQQYAAILNGLQNAGAGPNQQNMGMGGQQMGNQQQMMQGIPPNMSNAVPAFNSQPPPNQNQQQQGQNNVQANHMQKMQAQQMQMMKQRAMDLGEYPKPVLQNLGIQVPPEARTWGDIKRHIQDNPAVIPPNLLEKLHQSQQQWYTAHPEELRAAMTQLQQQMQQMQQARHAQQGMQQQQGQPQMPPSARPPSAQPVPNGQAPPAQMVPPNAQMQQQQPNQNGAVPNFNQMQRLQPTMEEMAMFRARVPNAANMTEEQIRGALMRKKQQAYVHAQQQQMQQAQQAQSMRRAQALANGGQPPAPDANMQQQQQQQQQRPGPPQQPPNQQMNMQGQKRQQSSSDDVMEIPNPNQPPPNNAQRPGAPPVPMRPPTKADLDKLPPEQRIMMQKRMEALRRAQGGMPNNQGLAPPQQQQAQQPQQPVAGQPKPPGQLQTAPPASVSGPEMQALENRIKTLWEEVKRTTPKGPPITLDTQGLEQVQTSLKRLWSAVYNLDRTFYPALRAAQLGEEKVKHAMKAKIVVEQNAKDKEGTTKDYLAVSPVELKRYEMFIGQYFTALKDMKTRQDAARAAAAGVQPAQQQQQQAAQAAAQPTKPQPPAAPERKPSQSQIRKQSAAAANKAPPAPTDNTKTFDWGAQSPQGVPKYEANRTELTADKLKLPPQKKRRTGGQAESAESTPAAQTSTPQATGASPSVTAKGQAAGQPTKLQPQAKVEAPKFKCDDSLCDYSIRGFDTQEQLNQHRETVHKPIDDPLQFLQDAIASAEKNPQSEKPAVVQQAPAQPRGKPMPAAVKKEGQTPDIKTEALTPRPGSSVGKSSAKPTPTLGKKAADAKAAEPAIEGSENEKTLLESMASKISFDLPTLDAPAPPFEVPIDNNNIWEDLFMNANMAGATDWSEDPATFCAADWGLRPEEIALESSPELTPSDGTSQSSRESDISASERLRICFEWDAFGNGDTAVPEGLLQMQKLRMGEGKDGQADGEKKDAEMFDWGDDMVTWDALFGANAGLEGDEMGMVF